MLLGGDELGITHRGNNNAYPLDELNWYDWGEAPHRDMIRRLTALRRAHPSLRRGRARLISGVGACAVEVSDGNERLVIVANPAPNPETSDVPDGQWTVAFDSSGTLTSGAVAGRLEVPAWTVLLLRPVGGEPRAGV